MMSHDPFFFRLVQGTDSIYSSQFNNTHQLNEIQFRNDVSSIQYHDYLDKISRHHSIPVMDHEVRYILSLLPPNAHILDIGGCWGWHWRDIRFLRPDIKVFILDFSRPNLVVANNTLDDLVNDQIFLVHGDATSIPFDDGLFDLVWSVQTFQHIPNYFDALLESYRVLQKGTGHFLNYYLNNAFLVAFIYHLFGKNYILNGKMGPMHLERASSKHFSEIWSIFNSKPSIRYSEILFTPELNLPFGGRVDSFLGKVDSRLSSSFPLNKFIARQQSFHVIAKHK